MVRPDVIRSGTHVIPYKPSRMNSRTYHLTYYTPGSCWGIPGSYFPFRINRRNRVQESENIQQFAKVVFEEYKDDIVAILRTEPKYIKAWYIQDKLVKARPDFYPYVSDGARGRLLSKILSSACERWKYNVPRNGAVYINPYCEDDSNAENR